MKNSTNKLLIGALLLSVAVNLFLVGGIVYRVTVHSESSPRLMPRNVSWLVRDLSEARRQELQPLLESNRQDSEALRREMFTAQRRVNELMASSNFDGDALDAAFTQLRNSAADYQALSHRQTITILSNLTEAERKLAQEFLQRRGPRGGGSERDRPPRSNNGPD